MAKPTSRETSERIRTAALDAFWAKGYHATTTREIAAAVGLSSAAVYVHFQSKSQLLASIVLESHAELAVELDAAAAESTDPAARLARLVQTFSAFNASRQRIAIVAERELDQLDPDDFTVVRRHRDHIVELLRHTVDSGIASGRFATDPSEAHDLVFGIVAISKDLARWYRPDGPLSPEELGAMHGDWALRLVRSRAAPDPINNENEET